MSSSAYLFSNYVNSRPKHSISRSTNDCILLCMNSYTQFISPKINFSTIDINTSKIVYQETGKKVIVTVDAFNSIDKTPLGPNAQEFHGCHQY